MPFQLCKPFLWISILLDEDDHKACFCHLVFSFLADVCTSSLDGIMHHHCSSNFSVTATSKMNNRFFLCFGSGNFWWKTLGEMPHFISFNPLAFQKYSKQSLIRCRFKANKHADPYTRNFARLYLHIFISINMHPAT